MRLFCFSLLLASSQACAGELAVGRYTRIVVERPAAPLSTPVLSKFVAARSVGDAVRLVLRGTGYRLADLANSDPMQTDLLGMPLPDAHRDLSALASLRALVLLGGPGYRVMVDHVHRLVGFEVRPRYWHYAGLAGNRQNASAWTCSERSGRYRCVPRVPA